MSSRITSLLQKLRVSLKSRGLRSTLFWAWFNCTGWHTFEIYMVRTEHFAADIADDRFSLVVADAQAIAGIQQGTNFQTPDAFISDTLRYDQCLLGLLDGEPAHVMWVFQAGDDSRFFDPGPGEAEINYCYTPPRFRGLGMYQKSLRAAIWQLRKQGIERVYMATHNTNEPSKHAIAKAGFTRVGKLLHFGVVYRPKWKPA